MAIGQGQVPLPGAGEGAARVERLDVELDRPPRQDGCPTGGDEGGDNRLERMPAPVAAGSPAVR
jgi:hypothetical protein